MPPPRNNPRMNVDASVDEKEGLIGIGVVILLSVRPLVREGTRFALSHGFAISEVENNSKKTCSALQFFESLKKESSILSDIVEPISIILVTWIDLSSF
ncbi:hypothetical protein PanWU01x14_238280, partial [Parasponia andersonii]